MKLLDNTGAIFLFPVPACFQKFITAQVVLVHALFSQLIDDLDLSCNRCMVGTRLPQCLITLHSFVTGQDILHGIV